MPIGLYRIGAVSRRTGLTPATLRLWEEQYGLLAPQRSRGGTRLYSEADVERVHLIRTLVRERGFTLEAVARVIDETELPTPSADGGTAVQNVSLWEATNREFIEEGRRMAAVHPLLRQLVRAESGWRAAVALVEGARTLTGAHTASLGLYRQKSHSLAFVVTLRGNRIQPLPRQPLAISAFPRSWQEALNAREAYADPDLLRLDLNQDISDRISEDRTRSFHAEPLTIGEELVGVLVIGSPQPGGMSREACQLTERLAVPAGPAIYYYASGL
jgi:DNA-binding transcriptional MerR regulator